MLNSKTDIDRNIKETSDFNNIPQLIDMLKSNLPTHYSQDTCVFDRIYLAGCYANLSYGLSKIHYDTPVTHETTLDLMRKHQNVFVEIYDNETHPSAAAIVIPLQDEVIIALHGINFENKTNHLTNFDSHLVPSNFIPGSYHAGFLGLVHQLLPKILIALQNIYGSLDETPRQINIYGHSMGAGLAQILTQYLQHQHSQFKLETIVFGSPKAMCPIAVNAYNQANQTNHTIRVETPLDLAIYMPAQFLGYGVVNKSILLPTLHSDIIRSHEIEGYLESIDTLRLQFRTHGISTVSLEHYIAASARFNPVHPWMSYNHTNSSGSLSAISEFMQLMGHGISKGIQSLIRALPFK